MHAHIIALLQCTSHLKLCTFSLLYTCRFGANFHPDAVLSMVGADCRCCNQRGRESLSCFTTKQGAALTCNSGLTLSLVNTGVPYTLANHIAICYYILHFGYLSLDHIYSHFWQQFSFYKQLMRSALVSVYLWKMATRFCMLREPLSLLAGSKLYQEYTLGFINKSY
jgi:hypothetical protein